MKKFILILTVILISMSKQASAKTAHDFEFKHIEEGKKIDLSDYKGKVLLVVNTACMCGFTPQFSGLEKLYQQYKDKGLVIVGIPSNDFGGQELDSEEEVEAYTQKNFSLTFPLSRITKVSGEEAHPFFKWAGEKAGFVGKPKWNFHKYLISKNGEFIDWFASITAPSSDKLTAAIEKELQK